MKRMNQRWSQCKLIVNEYENIGGNSGGDINTGTFKERDAEYLCNTPLNVKMKHLPEQNVVDVVVGSC